MEVHYINVGFPYTITESFMDFFEGLNHMPQNYSLGQMNPHLDQMHDQDNVYWSMNANPYKFGMPGPGNTSYYGGYEVNDHFHRMDVSRRTWEYPSTLSIEEPDPADMQSEGNVVMDVHSILEERTPDHDATNNSSQVIWQDNIDPDYMSYEELLDLGEAVGTQSRGLSRELINLLPISRYKRGSFFSRKKSKERCVVCQMRYKRGDRQTKLPCKHIYHTDCISKWLSINKVCPVCNMEVFVEESRQQSSNQ